MVEVHRNWFRVFVKHGRTSRGSRVSNRSLGCCLLEFPESPGPRHFQWKRREVTQEKHGFTRLYPRSNKVGRSRVRRTGPSTTRGRWSSLTGENGDSCGMGGVEN